jgi:hypothetical protein
VQAIVLNQRVTCALNFFLSLHFPTDMLRCIVILLILALPLRSGMAAAQICPWMAAGLSVQTSEVQATTSASNPLVEDCAGMSAADGHCTLQAGCATPPLIPHTLTITPTHAMPVHASWHAVHTLFTYAPVPQRIPIAIA